MNKDDEIKELRFANTLLSNKNKALEKQIMLALLTLEEFVEKYNLWEHKELQEIEKLLRGN